MSVIWLFGLRTFLEMKLTLEQYGKFPTQEMGQLQSGNESLALRRWRSLRSYLVLRLKALACLLKFRYNKGAIDIYCIIILLSVDDDYNYYFYPFVVPTDQTDDGSSN